ncbi:hypothetical protein JCM15519_12680 [Fundidesulfovibrio butyratiphilus]
MSSSEAGDNPGGFLPGNARVILGTGAKGPSEMTVLEMEGTKKQELDEQAELAFWNRVRAKAQAKAREILSQAMAEAEVLREQARQEGFVQGLDQAKSQCDAQILSLGQQLSHLLAGLEGERHALWTMHRQEFAALLRLAVEKTLHTELSERRQDILGNLLDQAVELLDTRNGFTVVVAPEDEAGVHELLARAKEAHPGLGPWRVRSDPALVGGGVRLESEAGLVDNAVGPRYAQIAELLSHTEFTSPEG